MEMCRACLTTGKDMAPMDEAFLNKYNLLTNINLTLNDMPLYSCNTCFDAIKFCTEFREKCISSDLTLKEILFPFQDGESKVEKKDKDSIFKIKHELKLEYESDSIIWEDFYDEPFDDYDLVKTKEYEDWAPKKTLKQLKTKVKKEQRMKHEVTKVNKEKLKKDCDDAVVHCGICTETFGNRDDLEQHLEHHKQDRSCGLCSEQFLDSVHLLAHRLVHLPKKEKKCYLCPKKFITAGPEVLEFHYINQHNLRGEDGKLLCKTCLAPFDSPRKLGKHVWAVHSDIRYTCDECGKGFRVKQSLRSHLNLHREERRFQCDLCDFTCKFPNGVREHKVRKHTAGRVYCKTCGRVFPSQERLEKHSCKHVLTICPICGVYVSKPSTLTRHMESHTKTYRYECSLCPSKFKSDSAFRAHKNKHAGTKPFRCQYCPMSFYSHPVLIKHRRTHTGERPYVCKICQKGFTANHNLKVHMKVHGQNLIVKRNTEPQVHIFEHAQSL